jgi:hypothetical protein
MLLLEDDNHRSTGNVNCTFANHPAAPVLVTYIQTMLHKQYNMGATGKASLTK